MANPTKFKFSLILSLLFVLSISKSFLIHKSNALKVRLIHRDSPESPMYRPNLTEAQRMEEYVQISRARVQSLANRVKVRSNATSLPYHPDDDYIIHPTMIPEQGLYLVQMGIGKFDSPEPVGTYKWIYLALDTGSDLIWTQCEGCNPCFPQAYPYFPASQSKTYKPISCSDCGVVGGQCNQDRCEFVRSYLDGSTLKAIAAQELFGFHSEEGQYPGLTNVFFGCGYSFQGSQWETKDNHVSGLLGMSYGALSFVERGVVLTHGRFSYCLQVQSQTPGAPTPMFLRLGASVIQKPEMKTTPMPRHPHPIYYLNLEGISVGDVRLDVPPDVFKIRPDGSGGCVIDSGAAVSLIATEAYAVFEKALNTFMLKTNKNLRKMRPELWFDICYERFKGPDTVVLPYVTFHFENNADFVIKNEGSFYLGFSEKGTPMICSNFIDSTDQYRRMTLLGAMQQVNHRVIFDLQNQQLIFGEADCLNDN